MHALRTLRKTPGFTAVAILTLALGVGGTTAFFSILDAALFRPLPFPNAERLVRLRMTMPAAAGGTYIVSVLPAEYDFLVRRSHSFDAFSAQRDENFTMLMGSTPVRVGGLSVSAGSLSLLGVSPVIGRGFSPEEERIGEASNVILISHHLWLERFGADPGIAGRQVRFTDRVVSVIGVLPPHFRFPYDADVWQPFVPQPGVGPDMLVIGRLRTNATIATARKEMAGLMDEMRVATIATRAQRPVDVMGLRENVVRGQEGTSLLLFAAAALFLLMACANLTNLLLARAVTRRRDVAIRTALGATRQRLIAVEFGEPAIIALSGVVIALVTLHWVAPSLGGLMPEVLSRQLGFEPFSLNVRVAIFAVAVALFSTFVSALGPALYAGRDETTSLLRSAGAANRAVAHRPLRALLIGETALLCVLLLSAGALVEGFVRLSRRPPGFDAKGLLAIEIAPSRAHYDDSLKVSRLVENVRREVAAVPGIRVGVSTVNPVRGTEWGVIVRPDSAPVEQGVAVNQRLVTAGILKTEGVALLRGHEFNSADMSGAPVAIVSRRLARRFWNREDVIGERIARRTRGGSSIASTVIGVADDVDDAGDLRETVYLPFDQLAGIGSEGSFWVIARGDTMRTGWTRDVERAIRRVDPELAWSDFGMMDAMRYEATARERLGTRLALGFGAFAILLAGLGLGGVMAFILGQRETEIGVRLALGADAGMIVRLLTREGMRIALFGVCLGLIVYATTWPVAMNRIAGLRVPGMITFAIAVGLILSVSAAAAGFVARRAGRVNPLVALRRGA